MRRIKKKKCRNCRGLFTPNPKSVNSQSYCFKSACRKASKKASQKKWLSKPENQDYFRGPGNVERVREWRRNNPGYWKKAKTPNALQDALSSQVVENKTEITHFTNDALQDFLQAQPPVIVGLIANFTGSALQDDIAATLLRMKKYGQDILCSQPKKEGETNDHKIPHCKIPDSKSAQKLQLDRSPPGT